MDKLTVYQSILIDQLVEEINNLAGKYVMFYRGDSQVDNRIKQILKELLASNKNNG